MASRGHKVTLVNMEDARLESDSQVVIIGRLCRDKVQSQAISLEGR